MYNGLPIVGLNNRTEKALVAKPRNEERVGGTTQNCVPSESASLSTQSSHSKVPIPVCQRWGRGTCAEGELCPGRSCSWLFPYGAR